MLLGPGPDRKVIKSPKAFFLLQRDVEWVWKVSGPHASINDAYCAAKTNMNVKTPFYLLQAVSSMVAQYPKTDLELHTLEKFGTIRDGGVI